MSNPVLTEQQAAFILKMKQEHQPKEQTMNQETKPEETKSDRRKFPIQNRGVNEKVRKFFTKNRQATVQDAVIATGAPLSTIYNVRYALRKKNPKYFDVKKPGPKPALWMPPEPLPVPPVPVGIPSATPDMVNSPPHYKAGGIETIEIGRAHV